ncbi:phosphate acyltransferase PlsX [Longirhabdus pacifica]|uniref:phosphate acyltransferase PlsX n=1 Tax=Longirhabdus pacifica TaxID=2305227 RepID=UPI0010089E9B|nr:phosphate acyltransferase PlsX [Longirhabdus pacifica]
MKVAIDAMGGDHAPHINVEGALQAAKQWNDIDIVLVGNKNEIEKVETNFPSNIHIHHTEEVILPDDEPVRAVRRKKNASMVVAGKMVKEKEVDAMISCGNTGALMSTGVLIIGRIKGVERPALASMIPTADGKGVMALDLGANMDAAPEHLYQYAVMGSMYRHLVDDLSKPRVGLLNVGSEQKKGNDLIKKTYPLLQEAPIHFIGNVESRDVVQGNCDVMVCDGFVGNVMLKAMEGTGELLFSRLKEELTKNMFSKMGALMLKRGLMNIKSQMDHNEYGGAPLLGLDGICLKCHGSSNATAIKNAVGNAIKAHQTKVVDVITSKITRGE